MTSRTNTKKRKLTPGGKTGLTKKQKKNASAPKKKTSARGLSPNARKPVAKTRPAPRTTPCKRAKTKSKPAPKVVLSKRKRLRRRKVAGNAIKKYKDGLPLFVVDEHDGSMVATLRAIEKGNCPNKFKFLHYDSHPDLGCMPDEHHELLDECWNGVPSIKKLYKNTDIATWITPLVLMGHCDYVVWACGHWCTQFNPGRWDLLVGKDKNDGRIKIGTRGNHKWRCLDYWESGGCVCKEEDFEYCREWTLEVVRYGKNGRLPSKQHKKLLKEFGSGEPWVLDVDEDFFSCNNPYKDEFLDLFGAEMYETVSIVYDGEDQPEMNTALKTIFKNRYYAKPWKTFKNLDCVKTVLRNIQLENEEDKIEELQTFRRFLTQFNEAEFDDSSDEEEEEEEEEEGSQDEKAEELEFDEDEEMPEEPPVLLPWEIQDLFSLNDLHRVGCLSCLPHHISTAKEISGLVNEVDQLLQELPEPAHVTVATSRLDRYLPDSQAVVIHGAVEDFLGRVYDTDNIHRLDRPKFSVDNIPFEDMGKVQSREILEICSDDDEEE